MSQLHLWTFLFGTIINFSHSRARISRTRRNDITGQCTNLAAFECVNMDGLLPYVQTFCRSRLDACSYIRTCLTIGTHFNKLLINDSRGFPQLGSRTMVSHFLVYYCCISPLLIQYLFFGETGPTIMPQVLPQWLSLPHNVRLMTSAVTRFYDVRAYGFDVSGFETEYCQWLYFHSDVLWINLGFLVVCYFEKWSHRRKGSSVWFLNLEDKLYLAWANIAYIYRGKSNIGSGRDVMTRLAGQLSRSWRFEYMAARVRCKDSENEQMHIIYWPSPFPNLPE